ncbi:MAG TPA: T9SS type A sorting domain-containing protein [Candidatus Kapabacteria bacterium]|nr:T9SS type A sorting domain-containing protein [Candidatus Kapabacteria bacterium]
MTVFTRFTPAIAGRAASLRYRLAAAASALLLLIVGLAAAPQMQAQCNKGITDPCKDPKCSTQVIQLGTGYDQINNTTYNAGDKDNYWTIVQDGAHGLTVPRAADVIKPAPIWPGPLPNSQWIGAFPGSGDDGYLGTVTYERCFCVCGDKSEIKIDLDILVDDAAIVTFDGSVVAIIKDPGYVNPTHVSFGQVVTGGRHCIQIQVQNVKLPYAGLDVSGTVSGAGLLRDECCSAEVPIKDPCCQTDRLVIPTDDTWTITTGPAAFAPYPQCATIISNPHPAWHAPVGGTNWIGTNASGTSGPWGPNPDIYVYHKGFCVEQDGTYIITITSMADDVGTIILNGVVIGNTGGFTSPVTQTFIVGLTKGCNCFDFEVQDIGFVVTGLDAMIDIQGGLLLKPECCDCSRCAADPQPRNHRLLDGASGVAPIHGSSTSEAHPMLVSIPNPTTGDAEVHYVLDHNANAQVELFNNAGQRVLIVDQGERASGQHQVPVSTKGLPAGTYHLQLKYDGHTLSIPVSVQ